MNYDPNSWTPAESGPREDPDGGFRTPARNEEGATRRVRPDSFADHFSQARHLYLSQTPVEQAHICDAFVFELSKVERPDIRSRMVANLLHVDETSAATVAAGLGLVDLPEPAQTSTTPRDLPASLALSILADAAPTFVGRKLGGLVTDGSDAVVLDGVRKAAKKAGARVEVIAPTVGGVTMTDGSPEAVDRQLDGSPSVLFDAVAVIPSLQGAAELSAHAPALDFLRDAQAHSKFVAFGEDASELLTAAGVADLLDDDYVELDGKPATAASFLESCAKLRFWDREPTVNWRRAGAL